MMTPLRTTFAFGSTRKFLPKFVNPPRQLQIQAIGSGGSGASNYLTHPTYGQQMVFGGGGGGSWGGYYPDVTPGSTYSITIGFSDTKFNGFSIAKKGGDASSPAPYTVVYGGSSSQTNYSTVWGAYGGGYISGNTYYGSPGSGAGGQSSTMDGGPASTFTDWSNGSTISYGAGGAAMYIAAYTSACGTYPYSCGCHLVSGRMVCSTCYGTNYCNYTPIISGSRPASSYGAGQSYMGSSQPGFLQIKYSDSYDKLTSYGSGTYTHYDGYHVYTFTALDSVTI